ncbi:phage tail protein [Siccibacter colletis]|uniref:phage tail protein n=1 Tax=Siccibacter colletis TaxID=1505757 RepID=UPI0004E167F8|nr:phage tail protein [Siccibacter colletis]
MAIDTFTWGVLVGGSESINVATLQSQFGDGYKQVSSAGINTAAATWTLSRRGNVSDIAEVRTFLASHVTVSFWWTDPWGDKKLFRVRADSVATKWITESFVELSFTFEQAFAP